MASPTSTGGTGFSDESRIAATYLAAMLCDGSARPLGESTVVGVEFQVGQRGHPLDDLLVVAKQRSEDLLTACIQIKRQINFSVSPRNKTMRQVATQCWDTFRGDVFSASSYRMCIARVGRPSRRHQQEAEVLEWARAHSSANAFFATATGKRSSNRDKRGFIDAWRVALKQVSGAVVDNELLWKFFRSLWIMSFDVGTSSSSDDENAIERLRTQVISGNTADARKLFDDLVRVAEETRAAAGGCNREGLVRVLCVSHSLTNAPSFTSDIAILTREGKAALHDIRNVIGNTYLPRPAVLAQAAKALGERRFLSISGQQGCGKSVVLRALAEQSKTDVPLIVLNHNRVGGGGWSALAERWRLTHGVQELATELHRAGVTTIYIDGLDRCTPEVALTLADIVRTCWAQGSFKFVATCRKAWLVEAHTWIGRIVGTDVEIPTVTVDELTSDEVRSIARDNPSLGEVVRPSGAASQICHSPFFLDRLIASRLPTQSLTGLLTEVDLADAWFRGSGLGLSAQQMDERAQLLSVVAHRLLRDPDRAILSADLPTHVSALCHQDGTLSWDESNRLSFSHDIYEDWLLARAIADSPGTFDLSAYGIDTIARSLRRAIEVAGQMNLERADDAQAAFRDLVICAEKEVRVSTPLRAALMSALRSPDAAALLMKLEPLLFENDGKYLRELIKALETEEVAPNPIYDMIGEHVQGVSVADRQLFSRTDPLPLFTPWLRALTWVCAREHVLPFRLKSPIALLVERWLTKSSQMLELRQHFPLRRELGELAHRWLIDVEDNWSGRISPAKFEAHSVQGSLPVPSAKALRRALFACAWELPDEVTGYLERVSASGDRRRQAFVLENCGTIALALPAQLVDFILKVVVLPIKSPRRMRREYGDEIGFALDQECFYPAHPLQSPFNILFRSNSGEALRLINALCNHALSVWRSSFDATTDSEPIPIKLWFDWGEVEVFGNTTMYCWFRGGTSGPNIVISALMALEEWMETQATSGRPINELIKAVMSNATSIAVVGPCVKASGVK